MNVWKGQTMFRLLHSNGFIFLSHQHPAGLYSLKSLWVSVWGCTDLQFVATIYFLKWAYACVYPSLLQPGKDAEHLLCLYLAAGSINDGRATAPWLCMLISPLEKEIKKRRKRKVKEKSRDIGKLKKWWQGNYSKATKRKKIQREGGRWGFNPITWIE